MLNKQHDNKTEVNHNILNKNWISMMNNDTSFTSFIGIACYCGSIEFNCKDQLIYGIL